MPSRSNGSEVENECLSVNKASEMGPMERQEEIEETSSSEKVCGSVDEGIEMKCLENGTTTDKNEGGLPDEGIEMGSLENSENKEQIVDIGEEDSDGKKISKEDKKTEKKTVKCNEKASICILRCIKGITVEPTMFLFMMAVMLNIIVDQAFYIDKACRVNYGANTTVCSNLTSDDYTELNKKVQVTVASFHRMNDIVGYGIQIVLAFFMGAWSDKRGRKLPLLIGLTGKLYHAVMMAVNSLIYEWPLEYITYTVTLPMALTGADVAIFGALYSYLVDICSEKNRTIRITILDVSFLITMPTGISLGAYLFTTVGKRSFTMMYTIYASLIVLAILYTCIRLQWRTNNRQRPLSEANNMFFDFFDYKHVVETGKTLFKARPKHRRTYLLMLIVMMGLFQFERDENRMHYLYLQLVFKWTFQQVSNFKTFLFAIQDVAFIIVVPFMNKILGWRDTIIIMIGATAFCISRSIYAAARVGWVFYVGGAFATIGPIVGPVIRSMVSKIVSNSEKGKAFSVLSVADYAIPIIASTLYSTIYNFTISFHPQAMFYLTIATQFTVLVMVIIIHVRASDSDLVHRDDGTDRGCLEGKDKPKTYKTVDQSI